MSNGSKGPVDITAMTPAELAAVLSNAYRRQITEQQVRNVAEAGNLISDNGTVNLIQYTALLAGEVGVGRD